MTTGAAWALIASLALVTVAIRAFGPIAMGGRSLPPRLAAVIGLLPAALLAALVATGALTDGHGHLQAGADAVGVLAAGVVVLRGGSVLLAVVVAAALTATLRAVG